MGFKKMWNRLGNIIKWITKNLTKNNSSQPLFFIFILQIDFFSYTTVDFYLRAYQTLILTFYYVF